MDAKKIMESEEFKRCVDFHGHICPGLSIGFKAVKACMEILNETRAEDEELVAIVETDACSADAVQVLTGCTFGKGNFIFKDYGKMAVTLLSRNSGKGVRVSIQPNPFTPNEEHHALMKKVMSKDANEIETKRFKELHLKRSCDILEKPFEQLFVIKKVDMILPPKAIVEPSKPCDICGEPTMGSKLESLLESLNDKKICRGCLVYLKQTGSI
ncbi:MAG: formylmethanofuran dehydrogenase [Desulfobacterales bacterium]|nr:formylmethanofuran dehydrogenase [Desulfobacterales bacterium]